MNIKWNAEEYGKKFAFVHEYGAALFDLIDCKGGAALDLGCGNGALTKRLADAGFEAVGLDSSPEQLAAAKRLYPQIKFIEGDATDFRLPEKFDVVLSNAVFHWIDKNRQRDMLSCVFRAMKRGGRLVFEMGGDGNNKLIHAALCKAFKARGYEYILPFFFPTIGQYAQLLEEVGFKVEYCLLFDRPTELVGDDGLKEWIDAFVKTPFKVIGDPSEREKIRDEAVANLRAELFFGGKWHADYVRLRMSAKKP